MTAADAPRKSDFAPDLDGFCIFTVKTRGLLSESHPPQHRRGQGGMFSSPKKRVIQ